MPHRSPDALPLSRKILRVLVVVNIAYGALIAVMLVTSFVAPGWLMRALDVRVVTSGLTRGMQAIMVLGIGGAVLNHAVLTRLLAIVDTVRAGDPFLTINATRLEHIAWAVLGLELLGLAIGAIANTVSSAEQPLGIGWSFSIARWIAVLLLFVLARVFDHGARMRADLEGTV
jgi:hypothetical protein